MLFFAFKASESPPPLLPTLLPISEIITKLSKTLITLLRYILPQPPWNWCENPQLFCHKMEVPWVVYKGVSRVEYAI